jgi:hypothetical protein
VWGGAFFGVEPVNDVIDVDFASLMHVEELQQSTQRSRIINAVETSETKKKCRSVNPPSEYAHSA